MVRFFSIINLLSAIGGILLNLIEWFEDSHYVPSWVSGLWVLVISISLFFSLVIVFLPDIDDRSFLGLSLLFFFGAVFFVFEIRNNTRIEEFPQNGKFGLRKTSLLFHKNIYPAEFDTIIPQKIIAWVWKYENEKELLNVNKELLVLKKNNKYGVFACSDYNAESNNNMIIPVEYDSIVINSKQIIQLPDTAVIQVFNCYIRGVVRTLDYQGKNPSATIEIHKKDSDDYYNSGIYDPYL